jgi:hypothetical protein
VPGGVNANGNLSIPENQIREDSWERKYVGKRMQCII